jgi:hypothetical protein
LESREYAELEEDIERNFADLEEEHSNIVRFGVEGFADNGASGLAKIVHDYLELLTLNTEYSFVDTAVVLRTSALL